MDGLDVLFRVALAILRNNEAELLGCKSIPAVYVALENLPTRMWEADKLLQVSRLLLSADMLIRAFSLYRQKPIYGALFCIQISFKNGNIMLLFSVNYCLEYS